MKFILSGFLPFRNQSINPSQLIVEDLTAPMDSEKIILPVVYEQSWNDLKSVLNKNKNYFSVNDFCIIMLGQAAGRKNICLEKYAHNLADSSLADEAGFVYMDQKILLQKDLAFDSELPLRAIANQASELKWPVEISYSAGAYVCNYIYYQTLNWLKENHLPAHAAFIHLPLMEDLDLVQQKKCIAWILEKLSL